VRTRISDSHKTKKKKRELPNIGIFHFWEAPSYLKSSLHIGQGTILRLFMELRAQPQPSVGHKNLGGASKLFINPIHPCKNLCLFVFSVVEGSFI
jgi:hypothetical protein